MFFFDRDLSAVALDPGELRTLRARGGNLTMAEFIFEPGAQAKLHSHPHEQVAYVIEGEVDFTVGAETRRLAAGDSVYIASGVTHGCKALVKSRVIDAFTPRRVDFERS
jgi:quercetin dioxygenase-like cupin family protein